MLKVDMNLIKSVVAQQNPWWENLALLESEAAKPKRFLYPKIKRQILETNLITAVTGLRRVGKTTLMKQLIHDLVTQEATSRHRILYFSFDEYQLGQKPEFLEAIIEYWRNSNKGSKSYLFLDEIQYVDSWNSVLKRYVDLDESLKFIVSGSSSLFIKTKSKESLAGRLLESTVHPLSFGEYLTIAHGVFIKPQGLFQNPFEEGINEMEMLSTFHEYLVWGEFPFLPKLSQISEKAEYVRTWIISKVIDVDLPKYKRIIRRPELSALVDIIFDRPGQLVEMQNLASDTGIARNTLHEYIHTLEETLLIRQIFNLGTGFRTRKARLRKIYPASVNAVALKQTLGPQSDSFTSAAGNLVETYVANYLLKVEGGNVYFFRQRQREVDFVFTGPETLIPIEVKYQNKVNRRELDGLLYYCHKSKIYRAVVITKNHSASESIGGISIQFTPAYFLI